MWVRKSSRVLELSWVECWPSPFTSSLRDAFSARRSHFPLSQLSAEFSLLFKFILYFSFGFVTDTTRATNTKANMNANTNTINWYASLGAAYCTLHADKAHTHGHPVHTHRHPVHTLPAHTHTPYSSHTRTAGINTRKKEYIVYITCQSELRQKSRQIKTYLVVIYGNAYTPCWPAAAAQFSSARLRFVSFVSTIRVRLSALLYAYLSAFC